MKKDLFKVLLLGLSVLGLTPLQSGQASAEDGQVLNIAHPVLQQNWSPLQGGGHAARWQSLSWAAPMYFDKDGKLTPYVLSSVESDDSYVNWTLHVNPDAVWSDGSKITAEDVVGTWNLSARPATKHARINLFLGGVEGFNDVVVGKAQDMTGLAIKGDATVSVKLASADPIFDQKIATALIAPVKISQAQDENGNEKSDWWMPQNGVVVSGPFMPESIDLDQGVLTLVPNPNFFGPKPKLKKIILTTVADAQHSNP